MEYLNIDTIKEIAKKQPKYDSGTIVFTMLMHMRFYGQSILIGWDEDDEMWECSWVTNGKRITKYGVTPTQAAWLCIAQIYE